MKVVRREKKGTNWMPDDEFNFLADYLYEYELKHGHLPSICEYSKKVMEWRCAHIKSEEFETY